MDGLLLAVVIAGPVCFSLAFGSFLIWLNRHLANERSERQAWADRVQAPEAATVAAFTRAATPVPVHIDTDAEDDRAFGRDITEDLEWIPLGGTD